MNFLSKTYDRIHTESAEHLKESRQSYCTHLSRSVGTSFSIVCAAAALLIHGIVPAWCKKTGQQMILRAADDMDVTHTDYPKKQE